MDPQYEQALRDKLRAQSCGFYPRGPVLDQLIDNLIFLWDDLIRENEIVDLDTLNFVEWGSNGRYDKFSSAPRVFYIAINYGLEKERKFLLTGRLHDNQPDALQSLLLWAEHLVVMKRVRARTEGGRSVHTLFVYPNGDPEEFEDLAGGGQMLQAPNRPRILYRGRDDYYRADPDSHIPSQMFRNLIGNRHGVVQNPNGYLHVVRNPTENYHMIQNPPGNYHLNQSSIGYCYMVQNPDGQQHAVQNPNEHLEVFGNPNAHHQIPQNPSGLPQIFSQDPNRHRHEVLELNTSQRSQNPDAYHQS
ncbi:hypothetical protein GQ43DRAFT_501366 [Delitschia confertaspora ATCC 74209]|uniref:Uncharacterized protein n=1 Tax=Delitschia confertaspora ATCC 74209 TaxID=1513339 RepID=A0A9P4JQJ7_9PLEO|nr:hypothetical protein GQ43DRAFT_501366 [Delitschia confertaspora ATCC 74209]